MRIEPAGRPRRRLVSLTPLIDVVFILLVFFMLASTFTQWRSLELGIPAESAAPADDAPEPLVVRVGTEALSVDGRTVTASALSDRVREALADDRGRTVIVRPDGEVRLQRLVTVMERLHGPAGGRITLQRGE